MDLCYKNQDMNISSSFFQMTLFHFVAPRGAASVLETFGFDAEEALQTLLWKERKHPWKGQILKTCISCCLQLLCSWFGVAVFPFKFHPLVMVFGSICKINEHHKQWGCTSQVTNTCCVWVWSFPILDDVCKHVMSLSAKRNFFFRPGSLSGLI